MLVGLGYTCTAHALGYVAYPDRHGYYISQQLGGLFKVRRVLVYLRERTTIIRET